MAKQNKKLIARWLEAESEVRARIIDALTRKMVEGSMTAGFQLAVIAVIASPHLR